MKKPTIAIIGASDDRNKFGNKAVRAYLQRGYHVFPVHPSASTIEGLAAYHSLSDLPIKKLDRISLYLPREIGLQVIEQIHPTSAEEVWLNPGADSPDLIARGRERGLNIVVGCSIVDIGINPSDL